MNELDELFPTQGGPVPRVPLPRPEKTRPWIARWDADTQAPATAFAVPQALLRNQGALARDLMRDRAGARHACGLTLVALAATALYGAILGSFGGPGQMAHAAAKFPLVVLGSCAICLPSFHIFNALLGARASLAQSANAVLLLAAAAGMILLAIAPVVGFFSLTTDAAARGFMVFLHVVTIAVAACFGLGLLWRVHRYAAARDAARLFDGRVLALWIVVFLLVAAQMAHHFGPLMSEGAFYNGERGFFLAALATP